MFSFVFTIGTNKGQHRWCSVWWMLFCTVCVFVFSLAASHVHAAVTLPSPPQHWTLTGSQSLYTRLYHSSVDLLDLSESFVRTLEETKPVDLDGDGTLSIEEERNTRLISDRIITAVAADMVAQYYKAGTNPLYEYKDDLLVWRTKGLLDIPPEELDLGRDSAGEPYRFEDVKLWISDVLILDIEEACRKWPPWWMSPGPEPVRAPSEAEGFRKLIPNCITFVQDVRRAVEDEREFRLLRQDLSLIAYGQESLWDGQLDPFVLEERDVLIPQLRTYDLLMDIGGVANVLGDGSYQALFANASQGEQCDSDKCPECLFLGGEDCGNGTVQGAEQCDDGNRFPWDGCDEFCQVEGDYCGDGKSKKDGQWWELCDEGGECPNGEGCRSFQECDGGKRLCRYTGSVCNSDADCKSTPPSLNEGEQSAYRHNSCRYVYDGVCKIGDIMEGTSCNDERDCTKVSECKQTPGGGFCTNHPYLRCEIDEDCTSCTFEEVWGTCYTTGALCNGDEDCPPGSGTDASVDRTDYCILEPEKICRPRTVGGIKEKSSCGEFCEQIPHCGDRVVYLDRNGNPEQCDVGRKCEDGSACFSPLDCDDGSDCIPRNVLDPVFQSCDEFCALQICGDKERKVNGPEQCDTGSTCWNGDECDVRGGPECANYGRCLAPGRTPTDPPIEILCFTSTTSFCTPLPPLDPNDPPLDPESNPCVPDESCHARSDDGDNCDALCQDEFCGDEVIQESAGERCDDGGECQNGAQCGSQEDCPVGYAYCEGLPDRRCQNYWDCPRGSNCVSANTSPGCAPQSNDGCSNTCQPEYCGDFTVQDGLGEVCDDGVQCADGSGCASTIPCEDGSACVPRSGDGCSASCRNEVCGNGFVDPGEECDDGNDSDNDGCTPSCIREFCGDDIEQDNEECDPGKNCVDGSSCTTNSDCPDGVSCIIRGNPSCTSNCRVPVQGNCRVEPGEECDDGIGGGGNRDTCDDGTLLFCGDGEVNLCGEECDPREPSDLDSIAPACCGGNDGEICCSKDALAADPPCVPSCSGSCDVDVMPAGTCMMPSCKVSDGCPADPLDCLAVDPSCGNGCLDPEEECDGSDSCNSDCKFMRCGDGSVDSENCEECDLGSECIGGDNAGADCSNDVTICDGSCQVKSNASCNSSCLTVTCGDCRADAPAEECDDGAPGDEDGCDSSCQLEYCGDGIPQAGLGEVCDDGGRCINGDACETGDSEVCPRVPYVCSPGGGTCQSDSDCDTGICTLYQTACAPKACDGCNGCRIEICGNGIVECDEECDDGDIVNFDGCHSDCSLEFCGDARIDIDGPDNKPGKADYDDDGNGIVDDFSELFFPGTDDEECDDGFGNNDIVFGACRTDCRSAYCGDAVVDSGEKCDVPTCPDGSLCTSHADCGGEWCRARDGQGRCSANCEFEGCGDGIVQMQYGEECDDGGTDSGDGCSAACQWEEEKDFPSCGNGQLDLDGDDGKPGIARFDDNRNGTIDDPGERGFPGSDDEECDFADPEEGVCPNGKVCSAIDGATCDLGKCDPVERICSDGNGFVCASDADCKQPCVDTCTPYCKRRVFSCGDGYRDLDEQCDDGNRRNGDGCSFYCTVENMDLCGNGIVDESYGEECDQGHPFHTLECTPYCRLAQGAPMCGDGRRDVGGRRRGDILGSLLTFSQGYRLDWRIPSDQALRPLGTYGWYVTPRVFPEHQKESAFPLGRDPDLDRGEGKLVDQNACDRCGDGILDTDGPDDILGTADDEACDSGRKSRGLHPALRANFRGWGRMLWAANHARFGNPFFWNRYYNLFPFGFYDYYTLTYSWFPWNWDYFSYLSYVNGFGPLYGYYAESVFGLGRLASFLDAPYIPEPCFKCQLQRCGNGRVDPGETCDDGGSQDGDGCSSQCFQEDGFNFNDPGVCGDDIISAGEQCDDGRRCFTRGGFFTNSYCYAGRSGFCSGNGADGIPGTDDDELSCRPWTGGGCSSTCQILPLGECGNGRLEPYEECDDGKQCDDGAQCTPDEGCNDGSTCMAHSLDGCTVNCFLEPPRCGNGIVEPRVGEQCDPPGGSCSTTCHLVSPALCGNGVRNPGEQCDAGENNSDTTPNACRTGCVLPFCGDGQIDRGEECDDGNAVSKDGCSFCTVELCGNGFVDLGEQCDDGNRVAGDGCSDWCVREGVCGNAELDAGEECDDGNIFDGDGCSGPDALFPDGRSASCFFEYCGDGRIQPGLGEECDTADQNANKKDACRLTCQSPYCGDAITDSDEACDPGKHCADDPSRVCKDDWQCSLGPCDQNEETCIGDRSKQCKTDSDCLGSCIVQDSPQEDGTVCLADCSQRFECGDGIVQYPEECDFRSPEADDGGCQEDCTLAFPMDCGNGRIEAPEQCDDGNRANHDGCTEFCRFESMECDDTECAIGFTFVCEGDGAFCQQESAEEDCTFGPCVLKPECAMACVFGDCGNGSVDPGEQCDNGRHCTHDPSDACFIHADCFAGSCQGANPSEGIPGACDKDILRACMTDADCQSLCVPTSGDGCSSTCQAEEDLLSTNASLRLCTDDVGIKQVFTWKQTLLNPNRNPFIERPSLYDPEDWNYWGAPFFQNGGRGSLGWGDRWWEVENSSEQPDSSPCELETFPNSLGNLLRSIVHCFERVSNADTIPDRVPFMPFQPTGILSYAACQEPRAQLVSAVEMPALPVFDIPPYRPSELVRELEKYICGRSGFPRRNFLFLCEASSLAPAPRSIFDSSLISLQSRNDGRIRELMLAHALDVGYRASESMLSSYLQQAFSMLASSLQVSLRLFSELERINFADQVCPLGGATSFCAP